MTANVLIVDDSDALVDVLSQLLSRKGYGVKSAANKKEIAEVLVDFHPDCVLLDVWLNGENGREICRELKTTELTKDAHVILLSATPENLQNYESCKADGAIEKPFDLKVLLEKINTVLPGEPVIPK